MKKGNLLIVTIVTIVFATTWTKAEVLYFNDFEDLSDSLIEWSNNKTDSTPTGRRFLGQFQNNTVSLTLNNLPAHTEITLSFDLYVIRSWDGLAQLPDIWNLSVQDGPTLLRTTFGNVHWADPITNQKSLRQAYPGSYPGGDYPIRTGAVEVDTLGYIMGPYNADSVYNLNFTFSHSESSLQLNFSAENLQDYNPLDESWGLDNVEVTVKPCALTGRIAFATSDSSRLFVINADGTSRYEVPLPYEQLPIVQFPQWSPDGKWLTFHGATGHNGQIYIVRPDGSGFYRVTDGSGNLVNPSFSPDGSQLAFHQVYGHLYTIKTDGTGLTDHGINVSHSRWSPDGRYVAYTNWGFTNRSDVFVYDFTTGNSTQITHHAANQAFIWVAWSPDGTKLAVEVLDWTTVKSDIWVMKSDGSNVRNLTGNWVTSGEGSPTWSPDGEYIVFHSERSGNLDIWYTPVDYFAPVNITNSPEDEMCPAITITEPDTPCMVYIPCGEFEMGDHFDVGNADEKPVHPVYLDSFYMSCYEIANQQYCDYLNDAYSQGLIEERGGAVYAVGGNYIFCKTTDYPYRWSGFFSRISFDGSTFSVLTDKEDHPLQMVSWFGAAAYCNWLSARDGLQSCYDPSTWECDFSKNGYRLPTEAEWEYAARGGLRYCKYPWGNDIDASKANHNWNLGPEPGPWTVPVGSYPANDYGLYDMIGNVWEYSHDWYSSNYYGSSPYSNPEGPDSGSSRVIRGGGYASTAFSCRVANREWYNPNHPCPDTGFRIVRNAEPDTGLVAYWSFDDALDPGHDDSGNGNDGTVYGATSIDGICGDALSFDGIDDYVDIETSSALRITDEITVGSWFWAEPDALLTDMLLVSRTGRDVNRHWCWKLGLLYSVPWVSISQTGNSEVSATGPDSVSSEEWHYLAMTYKPDTFIKLYLDGELVGEVLGNAVPDYINDPESVPIFLGAFYRQGLPPGHPFPGKLDEVRIYDRALSKCEIRELATPCEQPECWQEKQKLLAPDGAAYDRFGNSVSIDGTYTIVGACYDDIRTGSAYIFKKSNIPGDSNWYQQVKLNASDEAEGDRFGITVLISGDYAIVGADSDDDNGWHSGSAYIFKKSNIPNDPNWYEQCKLTASDGTAGDLFGRSVAIDGDYAIVGAYGDGSVSGSAYIFKKSETPDDPKWYEQCKLTASDGAAGDHFGHTVAISGDYVILEAHHDDDNGSSSGSAYIFKKSETPGDPKWYEQCKLTASDGAAGDYFGHSSISLNNDYTIVGAFGDDDKGDHSGAAYIFKKSEIPSDPNWYEQCKLTASDGTSGDLFGRSALIRGDYAIVGAAYDDDNGSLAGSVYIFKKSETPGDPNWYEQSKLIASDAANGDHFGISVAFNGYYAIVGAYFNDDNGANSGSAYIFENVCNTEPIADAGDDQEVSTGPGGDVEVLLDCSGSEDPDGDELTYCWKWTGGQDCDATGVNPTIVLSCGTYIIELIVNDGMVDSEPDYVQITVLDGTAPVISCPGNVTLECPADTNPANTGSATATDNCDDDPVITYSDVSSGACPQVIVRTWTATDTSGNSSTCTQTITVQDTTPPVISCPSDITLECPADTSPDATGQATASDTCGSVTITYSDVSVSGCGNTETITRTWTATDECGHSSTCVQTITVEDTTPPVVTVVIPQAGAALQDGVTLTAEASDTCGDVTEVYFYIREPGGTSGIPIGQEDLPGTLNTVTGQWEHGFDTTTLLDGYYVILAKATDSCGNIEWTEVVVQFSIRNWAVIELLPASEDNKAGRTMPVKFSLRIAESVDPAMPFVYNEQLEIRIYDAADPGTILQTSVFGEGSIQYRIESIEELYITNFKTKKDPAQYIVEIWRPSKNFMVGSFGFETVK